MYLGRIIWPKQHTCSLKFLLISETSTIRLLLKKSICGEMGMLYFLILEGVETKQATVYGNRVSWYRSVMLLSKTCGRTRPWLTG